jgi:hypothetical protein
MIFFNEENRRISELAKNLECIRLHQNTSISIDGIKWITPLSLLPLCASAQRSKCDFSISEKVRSEHLCYLKAIGFPFGEGRASYISSRTFIPITRIDLPIPEGELNQTVFEYIKLICSMSEDDHRKDLEKALSYVFAELTTNVFEHAKARTYWMFAQYWSQPNLIEFCLVDDGIGIRQRFLDAGVIAEDDLDAIREAVEGHSAKSPGGLFASERGYGIGTSIKVLTSEELKGDMLLISGSGGYLKKHANPPKYFTFSADWQGVIICGRLTPPKLSFDLNRYIT